MKRAAGIKALVLTIAALMGPVVLAQGPALRAGESRYRIKMALLPGDDGAALVGQIAATCGGQVEATLPEVPDEFVLTSTEGRVRLLTGNPHVRLIEEIPVGLTAEALVAAAGPDPTVNAVGSTWSTGAYKYDGSGNIYEIGTDAFTYDRAGRILSGTAGPGRRQDYTYDAVGNLKTITTDNDTSATVRLAVDAATNQIDAISSQYNARGEYDADGNMTSFNVGPATFAYDPLGMVKDATVGASRKVYLYSADDERVAVVTLVPSGVNWVEGISEWTLRGADQKVLRRYVKSGGTWTWDEDYIYRGGALLAAEVNRPEKTLHFHLDHLGTPRLITGNGGAEVSRHSYYAFGFEVAPPASSPERAKFTGHERDEANLDYMHARYYNPGWGRFLSVDPVIDVKKALSEPQLWNRYAYVTNNPLRYRDPDGRFRDGYGEKPMTAENLAMDENTPAVVRYSMYATGGLTAAGAAGFLGAGGLVATAKESLGAAGSWALANWDKVQRFAEGVVDFFSPGPSSGRLTSFERASNQLANSLRFTETTAARMGDAGRMVPRSILAQAIMTGARSADPQGAKGAIQITQNITKNGKDYVLQIIYREKDNMILHFHYAAAK